MMLSALKNRLILMALCKHFSAILYFPEEGSPSTLCFFAGMADFRTRVIFDSLWIGFFQISPAFFSS